ncbi:DUF559 domain-containing protein [Microbacterium protaetiae]|uniref:DUF559 domain-containing protein n=1 Tax=Microbacterium protaetiae TaxID=2509458 RepID=A0A4P6E9X3_9MICO|nr:DUF559 domain-containing protein [Microbacterium protaetiae]QAY58835.1 DUF559 domain-containing protein [Microbacterium protaetiae]
MDEESFKVKWDAATRAEILAEGMSRRGLEAAVRSGELVRARRDHYVAAATPRAVLQAVRIGGRLTCLSLLQLLGVFVFACDTLHVHIPRGASRLRSPRNRAKPLRRGSKRGARLHWSPLARDEGGTSACVGVIDALIHSVLCQQARHAVATLDSALNKGMITALDLAEIFHALPAKFAVLQTLVDARAQSGPETLVRLMLRGLGCHVDLQVAFEQVGFVDMVVDRWLVIECDSKAFHSTWEAQLEDYRRDGILASYGYCVFRIAAEDILYRPEQVLASLRGLVATRRTLR